SHYYNQLGMQNVYLGEYLAVDGTLTEGPSLSDFVRQHDPKLDEEMRSRLSATLAAMEIMRERAKHVETYDQMIASGNAEGKAVV
ncbi:MAG TPA: peptidase, partial [Pusillimonas sp.]|nr:peptidase [Pusillimonas sp.]